MGPKHKSGEPSRFDERQRLALDRAIEEISKIKFYSVTNGNYELGIESDKSGNFVFTFDMTDVPDLTIVATVSSNRVFLKGGWFSKERP